MVQTSLHIPRWARGHRTDDALTSLIPLLQFGFFVHHHPRDRHVGVLLPGFPDGLGQRLRGQETVW